MTIPPGLNSRGRDAYAMAEKTVVGIGEDVELCREALLHYARACDDEQTARDAWELDGRPMHAVGSTGALVAHPIAKAVREAQAHTVKLGRELGLSPDSRSSMGRTRGQQTGRSTAPDRKPGLRAA
jgi:P27 family predicted phage terminase small subunit